MVFWPFEIPEEENSHKISNLNFEFSIILIEKNLRETETERERERVFDEKKLNNFKKDEEEATFDFQFFSPKNGQSKKYGRRSAPTFYRRSHTKIKFEHTGEQGDTKGNTKKSWNEAYSEETQEG